MGQGCYANIATIYKMKKRAEEPEAWGCCADEV